MSYSNKKKVSDNRSLNEIGKRVITSRLFIEIRSEIKKYLYDTMGYKSMKTLHITPIWGNLLAIKYA